ncbi:uncharacterized protein B0H64DRAFT_463688 [Chaetomium fimeti]|uniref:Zn(2)-C6 fungal-type domain-containing protein n=1 Tax=Chaetomium fimeti TaxID=1854472 RepID=A0AAE0HDR0_9PEZI|nr:hypothetical protein B0H64DRAFT_463688 [Chaetomium fimeti]
MLIGPFDRRKRRHRCDSCTRSHLKCSGDTPCTTCVKRHQPCHYLVAAQKKPAILVDQGRQQTVDTYSVQKAHRLVFTSKMVKLPPRSDPALLYFSYYHAFLQNNKFSSLETPQEDAGQLMRHGDPEAFLRDAMLSLGALQASKLSAVQKSKRAHYQSALESYTRAIAGLRHALSRPGRNNEPHLRAGILWTTLLLGLFELMNDATGDGWLQHLVHGTAQALIAGSPSACISGSCSRFFTESKIFEVCRAILFNQPSFLAEDGWMALSASLRSSSTTWNKSQKALDSLLDIVVLCSSLRVRAAELVESLQSSASSLNATEQAQAISLEGFALRSRLRHWASACHTSPVFRDSSTRQDSAESAPESESQLLAATFFSATSIYLSGVFDYELCYWQSLDLPTSTLGEDEIQQHVTFILALSQRVLAETRISPLLLLFPLRVASARARQKEQKEQIMRLLGRVGSSFAVAGAIVADVKNLWSRNVAVEVC